MTQQHHFRRSEEVKPSEEFAKTTLPQAVPNWDVFNELCAPRQRPVGATPNAGQPAKPTYGTYPVNLATTGMRCPNAGQPPKPYLPFLSIPERTWNIRDRHQRGEFPFRHLSRSKLDKLIRFEMALDELRRKLPDLLWEAPEGKYLKNFAFDIPFTLLSYSEKKHNLHAYVCFAQNILPVAGTLFWAFNRYGEQMPEAMFRLPVMESVRHSGVQELLLELRSHSLVPEFELLTSGRAVLRATFEGSPSTSAAGRLERARDFQQKVSASCADLLRLKQDSHCRPKLNQRGEVIVTGLTVHIPAELVRVEDKIGVQFAENQYLHKLFSRIDELNLLPEIELLPGGGARVGAKFKGCYQSVEQFYRQNPRYSFSRFS